ncbi:MAG: hypothetical protein Q9182_006847 [Xanthomendoza sp. 2 TL-2023]
MAQYLFDSEDIRWSNAQERQSLPLRSTRSELAQTSSDNNNVTKQADTSGPRMTPVPQNHPRASVPNLLFESQTFRQAAWSQHCINQEGMEPRLAAQSEPNTDMTNQKQSVTPKELYKTRTPVESSSPPPEASNETEDEDENEALLSPASGEDEGQGLGELPSKTPAEQRAEKRRMKRFRFVGLAGLRHTTTHRLTNMTLEDGSRRVDYALQKRMMAIYRQHV